MTGANDANKICILNCRNTATTTAVLTVDSISILEVNTTAASFGTHTLTGNKTVDLANLTSAVSVSRAANAGVTLTGNANGNPTLPNVQFLASIVSTEGNNGENYTNTEAVTLANNVNGSGAAVSSYLTTYDSFTLSFGGNSVTATLAENATTGAIAAANIASTLMNAWNVKYSVGSTSGTLSAWTTATLSTALITAPTLQSSKSGSRFSSDTAAVTWTPATAAQLH